LLPFEIWLLICEFVSPLHPKVAEQCLENDVLGLHDMLSLHTGWTEIS